MNAAFRPGCLAVLAVAGVCSTATATVDWSNPSGSTPLFSWSNGYSNSGFFGDPVIIGNTFVFTPQGFSAVQGVQNTKTDTLQVDITAAPGQTILGVIIREAGSRSHSSGTSIGGTLFLKDLDDPNFPMLQDPLAFTFDTSVTPNPWTGTVTRGGLNMTNMQLSLTNNLSAFLSGRSITKTGVEIEIIVPAPASAAVVGLGLLGVLRRRR